MSNPSAQDELNIIPGALVCKDALLEGNVKIGAGSIVHPRAIIRAKNGPIEIGENNIVEETAIIENVLPDGRVLLIGQDNVFEIGSEVRANIIGNNNVFGVLCKVGPDVSVTNGCQVGVRCTAVLKEELPENIVLYGPKNERRIASCPPQIQTGQLEYLRRVLPSYHHLLRTKPKE